MRLPICILALAVSAWAAEAPLPDSPGSAAADSAQDAAPAQAPAPAPAPADAAKAADATPPAPPPKYDGFVFSGLADGYFAENFNHPTPIGNQLQNFDLNWGIPEMSLVKVTIDKSDKMFGFHIDAGFGETMRLIHAADVAAINHKALRYEEQMYLILKPNHMHGTEIDFGQFVTSAGAEVIEANSNWNYSRSLLFSWAIPYYHMGLRTSTPITKEWSVGLQVVNAWNTLWGNNDMKNVGITSALTKTKYTWSMNYYVGPNNPGTSTGIRNLVDSTLLLTPNSKINVYINGDYARNGNPTGIGSTQWGGIAGALKYQISSHFALTPRVEIFDDADGASTGKAQRVKEGTITGEYRYNDHFIGRLEYRHDASNAAFFDRGTGELAKAQSIFTIGLMAVLGPLK